MCVCVCVRCTRTGGGQSHSTHSHTNGADSKSESHTKLGPCAEWATRVHACVNQSFRALVHSFVRSPARKKSEQESAAGQSAIHIRRAREPSAHATTSAARRVAEPLAAPLLRNAVPRNRASERSLALSSAVSNELCVLRRGRLSAPLGLFPFCPRAVQFRAEHAHDASRSWWRNRSHTLFLLLLLLPLPPVALRLPSSSLPPPTQLAAHPTGLPFGPRAGALFSRGAMGIVCGPQSACQPRARPSPSALRQPE